jgi:hypothetical protein
VSAVSLDALKDGLICQRDAADHEFFLRTYKDVYNPLSYFSSPKLPWLGGI